MSGKGTEWVEPHTVVPPHRDSRKQPLSVGDI
jgi:hypothetical protein